MPWDLQSSVAGSPAIDSFGNTSMSPDRWILSSVRPQHIYSHLLVFTLVPWFPFSLSVGDLTFVNGIHQWPVIKRWTTMFDLDTYSHSRTCNRSGLCWRPSILVAFHIRYLLHHAIVHEISALVTWFQCMSDIFSHYGYLDPLYIFIMEIIIYYILYMAMTTHVTFCISFLFMAIVIVCS